MEKRMRVDRTGVQLTVYVAEPHVGDRRGKVTELLRRPTEAGASGATVLSAYQGLGRRHSHEPTVWHAADETPLTVIFVGTPRHIDAILKPVDEVLPAAVAVTERIRAVRYIRPHQH